MMVMIVLVVAMMKSLGSGHNDGDDSLGSGHDDDIDYSNDNDDNDGGGHYNDEISDGGSYSDDNAGLEIENNYSLPFFYIFGRPNTF
jgi:hypothetical protein